MTSLKSSQRSIMLVKPTRPLCSKVPRGRVPSDSVKLSVQLSTRKMQTQASHRHEPSFPSLGIRRPACNQLAPLNSNITKSITSSRSASSASTSGSPSPATSSAPLSASTTSPNNKTPPPTSILDWNTFFRLRKSRRRYNLIASVSGAAISTTAGIQLLSRPDVEAYAGAAIFGGAEPFVVLGAATAFFGLLGWLAGPVAGTSAFNMVNSKVRVGMMEKESQFYKRIKRYRVDPSSSNISNPVPDYYGEKIGSVGGYRQWLKDQRAFNKRRQVPV